MDQGGYAFQYQVLMLPSGIEGLQRLPLPALDMMQMISTPASCISLTCFDAHRIVSYLHIRLESIIHCHIGKL